ncbi:MAG: hypothetical protein LBD28_05705 [Tannerellaceae bacterium]|jgi:hypothetical protein|nr:hypothetical protein [Tannerellaceae bacterium]
MKTKPRYPWYIAASPGTFMTAIIPQDFMPRFNKADLAVINEIIERNELKMKKAPADGSSLPENWVKIRWSLVEKNRRIEGLIVPTVSGALDVSELSSLKILVCEHNTLTELNVSGLSKLHELDCCKSELTKLNISGASSLKLLECYGNKLTKLKLSEFSSLERLECYDNALTELDVSGLVNLTDLYCFTNQLTALDLSSLTSLVRFEGYLQHPSLTMKWNRRKRQYEGAISLNQPSELDDDIEYSGGKLIARNDYLLYTPFAVETGLEGKQLTGEIDLRYTK